MKFIDITALSPRPGRLAIWRADAPPLSSGLWTADPRPASHVQEAHITHALDSAGEGPLQPSWLGVTFDLPGVLDEDAFATALRGWTDRHETLRSRLAFAPSTAPVGRLHRRTLPTGAVRIHRTEAGDHADIRQLARSVEELFDREAGPLGWPGYVCATISRPEASTVCLAADHSLMDGYSVFLVAHEIHTLYAAALATPATPAPPPLPPTASYLDFAQDERAAADAFTTEHPAIVRWQRFLTEAGDRLPEFPVPVGETSGSPGTQPGGYTQLLDASAAHAFDRVCRAAGGDSFTGLLACLAKVGNEITGSDTFRTMAPFHTRTDGWWQSVGWYVGMAPIAFPLRATDSFAEAVRSAVTGLHGVRDLARIPVPRAEQLLGRPLRDPFMVSYMDLRRTPGARQWNTWRLVTLRGRTNDPDEVCFWITRTYDGLSVSYRHPATGPAGVAVPRYVARAQNALSAVTATGRWPLTPAPARPMSHRLDHA
ncbi:condensation domain-containing protein [Streptomyces sp. NBC_00078]|uniref:condensation domain-containing protein n=1 Tax=unclassified Streptomyces TaxID=2593676 RepID=UPI0022552B83|nr:condensation domain-containing protein [Streptomyces sp. NBC_00078]MCX5418161.1 condensation domain-containing protein [Streptomyces sp. NBC_00078]